MTYTSHGHWIGPGEPAIPRPPMHRCGGLLGCGQCRLEAVAALAAWMSKSDRMHETREENTMTWSARFKVTETVEEGDSTRVLAEASVDDGTLTQNTEKCSKLVLIATIDNTTTELKAGDEFTASGHFTG